MRKIISLIFIFLGFHAKAQYKVQFVLKENTAIVHDSIFIVGSFNNWDSLANANYLMKPVGQRQYSITLDLPAGETKYKFHRGNWLSVEKELDGNEVMDRLIRINADTTLTAIVESWRDQLFADKKLRLQRETTDTGRVKLLNALARNYGLFSEFFNIDSAQLYSQETLKLYQQISASEETDQWEDLVSSREVLANLFSSLGNYPRALELRFENLRVAEKRSDPIHLSDAFHHISNTYLSIKDYRNALKYARLGYSVLKRIPSGTETYNYMKWLSDYQLANSFYGLNELDSSLQYVSQPESGNVLTSTYGMAFKSLLLGEIYRSKNQPDSAFKNYRKAIAYNTSINSAVVKGVSMLGISRLFRSAGHSDSAIVYAQSALDVYENNLSNLQSWGENKDSYVAEVVLELSEMYKTAKQPDSAYKYLQLATVLKDSLYNNEKLRQFQILDFNETARVQQLEQQERITAERYLNRIKIYGLIGGLIAFLIIAFVLYRNNRQKQQSNLELTEQKNKLEAALQELKSTQAQLIQSEKMASLGELTAGIAHEIQNPLNFVNNFSEVSAEMIDEAAGSRQRAAENSPEVTELLNEIKKNLEKISHHGKRADAIVKSMMLHSRPGSDRKETTDLNAFADKYLRLVYHGLREKDNTLHVDIHTDYDPSIGEIEIIQEDISRVLLNVLSNAFYACAERSRSERNRNAADDEQEQKTMGRRDAMHGVSHTEIYQPAVFLSTKKSGEKIYITVKDNGAGISEKIIDRIFQPFFTTKPTGQGTGLGLSICYDIIKAHGGEIKVNSTEGEGSEFIITLSAIGRIE